MFARTVPSSSQLIDLAIVACRGFNWQQLAIMFATSGVSPALALALAGRLPEAGIRVGMRFPLQGSAKPALSTLRRTKLRVVGMVGISAEVRQWLLDCFDAGMTGQGWAVITSSITSVNALMEEDGRNADVFRATQGLISFTPAPPSSMTKLDGLLRRAAQWDRQEYGTQAVPMEQWSGGTGLYAGFAYDALQAIALAADAELRAGGNVANGTSLMNRLLGGMMFDGVMGRVFLAKNGDTVHAW